MGKDTYKNLVAVPNSDDIPIVGGVNSGRGGDIVANFKAIADLIYPESPNTNEVSDGSGSYSTVSGDKCALNIGCNFQYINDGSKSYHILNNTASYTGDDNFWSETSNSGGPFGLQSGAFMKGMLINPSNNSVELLDVPHAGGMLVEYNIIASDLDYNMHFRKGTLYVYPTEITYANSSDDAKDIGTFSVSNGDLLFTLAAGMSSRLYAIQIGLHGTILASLGYDRSQASATSVYSV